MCAKRRHLLLTVVMVIIAILLVSCIGSFRVLSPKREQTSSQDFSFDNTGHITIEIRFHAPVRTNTVVVGKTLVLVTDKDPNADGSLKWSGDDREVTFTTDKTAADLLRYDPDGHFTLKLIGTDTGDGAIKTKDGSLLDGDADGTGGGNYKTGFTHIG